MNRKPVSEKQADKIMLQMVIEGGLTVAEAESLFNKMYEIKLSHAEKAAIRQLLEEGRHEH